MVHANHYQTLNISSSATQAEIKQAYRQLVKRFHPDVSRELDNHDQIARINAAYEVLGDSQRRQSYDRHLIWQGQISETTASDRQKRTANAQQRHSQQRASEQDADAALKRWLKLVFSPVNRLLHQILIPLEEEISLLAADPFDDELMADFQTYLEDCRDWLRQAQHFFSALPNPSSVAGVAAHLYYCLNHVADGLEELESFTLNYDEHYLHRGQELFRIARSLRQEARSALQSIPLP